MSSPKKLAEFSDKLVLAEMTRLMVKHKLVPALTRNGHSDARIERLEEKEWKWKLAFDGMPQLPFFIELAKSLKIPLESIKTEVEDFGGGCDTCGYGGGFEVYAYIPRKVKA